MSQMIFPCYEFTIEGMQMKVGFKEFGYSYVVPVIFEKRIGILDSNWVQTSNTYWHESMEMRSFVKGDDSKRKDFARKAAENWRSYRKGWEGAA